jgi:hypothetical protein
MRPLYDARISDLGSGDFAQVERACGHTGSAGSGRAGARDRDGAAWHPAVAHVETIRSQA